MRSAAALLHPLPASPSVSELCASEPREIVSVSNDCDCVILIICDSLPIELQHTYLMSGAPDPGRGLFAAKPTLATGMVDLLLAVLLLLNTLQLLRVATPAPDPWRLANTAPRHRPAALSPAPGLSLTARAAPAASPVTARPRDRPTGNGRGAPRRRGRRGGVQWRRHGDIGEDHLIVGQLNVQSLLPKLPDLRADIDERFSFDILILSESWLSANTPDGLLNISGYKLVRKDRPRRGRLASGHGGVAICVRKSFETQLLPTPVTHVPNSNLEMVWTVIRVGKHRRLLVRAAYRVPKNTVHQVTADLDDFEAQLQHMIAAYPDLTIIIGGDMNCCLLRPGQNSSSGKRLSDLLSQHGMQCCNTRQPTYRPAGSLLDILATNRSELVTRAGVTRCHYGTPHDITRLALRLTGFRRSAGPVTQCRPLARVDKAGFNNQLVNTDWAPVYTAAGPDTKWTAFLHTFTPLLDSVAPSRRLLRRPTRAPPTSEHTRHLLAIRRAALSGDRQDYKEINRSARAAIRADCRRHLQEQLTRGGPGSLWRVLRPIIGSNEKHSTLEGITADALNDFYVSVAPRLAATVPAPSRPVHVRLPRVCTGGLRVQPVTMEALWGIIQGMKPSSFEGPDGLSVKTIQTFFDGFGHIVLDLVNASLETGTVPASWKHATITPIPKGKLISSDPSSTRPISMLPAITKITERAVQLQLAEYMERHHLLGETQHGYRKSHSCETALHVVTDDILRAMDSGELALWAMVDLSKCFDMVPHDGLIDKLLLYGVDPFWFTDYLNGHTQHVQTVNHDGHEIKSAVKQNAVGVYQGGSLSCILWCVLQRPLSTCAAACKGSAVRRRHPDLDHGQETRLASAGDTTRDRSPEYVRLVL